MSITRKPTVTFGRGVLLGIGVCLLLLAGIYLVYNWRLLPLPFVPYMLLSSRYVIPHLLGCFILPGAILVALISFVALSRRARLNLLVWIIPAFLLANLLMCGAALPTILGGYNQFSSLAANDRHYHADGEWKVGVGGNHQAAIIIWECDTAELRCSILHSETIRSAIKEADFRRLNVQLATTADNRAIELIMDGKVIYQHP